MPWLLGMSKKFNRSLLIGVIPFCLSAASGAVDNDRLWLPAKYGGLFLKLKEAAELTEQKVDRCQKVMRGTIDLEQSTNEKPIFRILCKQESGLTYNEMVDGLNMVTLTTPIPPEKTPEELAEEARLKAEAEALEKEKAFIKAREELWVACNDMLDQKIEYMHNVVKLTEGIPARTGDFNDLAEVRFLINFNAEDMDGNALRYQATCRKSEDKNVRLKVKPRKND